MTRTRLLLPFLILFSLSCMRLAAADTANIRCQTGETYVYLYQFADTLQVMGNIRCGQKVEILDAGNSTAVRVRTADGKEGYVLKSALTAIASGSQRQDTASAPETSVGTPQPAPAQAAILPLKNSEQAPVADQTHQGPAPVHADTRAADKAGKEKPDARIAAMKASGNPAGAAAVKADLRNTMAAPAISERLDAAMLAGQNAVEANHFDEAEKSYQEAVDLAEKVEPHDDRLSTSLMRLSFLYGGRKDSALAEATLQRYLKASEDIYGPESPRMTQPLQTMATYALSKQDFNSALDYYQRAIDLNAKTFGESSDAVALNLSIASNVFILQKAYDEAESFLLRALRIDEALHGKDGWDVNLPLGYLCNVYDQWGKPDKAAPCEQRDASLVEKQFGPNSPVLLQVLPNEAKALRALNRRGEAAKIEQRVQSIRAATGATAVLDSDGPPPTPNP